MVKIKICGITNLDDARASIEAGADMLGFNFYRPSPRFIEPKSARAIIERLRAENERFSREITTVGVFVNESSPAALISTVDEAGVDAVQLHGDESNEFCGALKRLSPDKLLIKVFRVGEEFQTDHATSYNADAIMLDAYDRNLYGGTGQVIDWPIARKMRELAPRLFISGGLSAKNVSAAIAAIRPDGVDACSALESSPGHKDKERVKAFVRAARGE